MIVSREVDFHARHSHHGMLSEPVHGHHYRVVLSMSGQPNDEGFVCDFRAVKRIFRRVVGRRLEGTNLDDILEYPTSENLAVWVWQQMAPFFPLYSVEVKEKDHSRATYYGMSHEPTH